MRERFDGSIQSTNVPSYQNTVTREDHNLYRCMVTKVLYVDDKDNITSNADNPEVLYNVVILGGFASGQTISNCRLASYLGGNNDFFERTLKATTKKLNEARLSEHDGDIVFVQFLQGHSAFPIITCLDKGIKPVSSPAKKSDGPRWQQQFNGVFTEINNQGEYLFVRKGGTLDQGTFTPNNSEEYKWEVLKDEKSIQTFKSGLKITNDGKEDKSTIETSGGAKIEVDGKSGKITLTKGSTVIELDGNGDKISLKGGFVDLGSSVSDFAVLFTELLTTFNGHTHPYIDATGSAATPVPKQTSPPTAPMLASVGSSTVKVQP